MVERFATLLVDLVNEALDIWSSGGWGMLAIAVVSIVLFGLGVNVWLRLLGKGHRSVPEETWRRWIERPAERRGPIGDLLSRVGGARSVAEITSFFDHLRATEIVPFERDLRVMKICVGAAPLVGLLGTVTGMLATFAALSAGAGGDETMEMVAAGISQALVTTETGLVVALPGLFFQYRLKRQHDRYQAFLAHLQTVCSQALHRRVHGIGAGAAAA